MKQLFSVKQKYIFTSLLVILLSFIALYNAFAATGGIGGGLPTGLKPPTGNQTFLQIVQNIIEFLIKLGAPILAIMVLYGGFRILTAGGNPQKVIDGRHIIIWAVIGYAIVLSSWGVIYIIDEIFGTKISDTLPKP